jgi:enamine deaminase RidA (YjgF/YER057c/UK114 family)
MSQVVIYNKTIYLAGQVATRSRGQSVSTQTKEILATIDGLLAEAHSDKRKLLSATIWLTDMATFAEMNAIWDAWIDPHASPARATIVSAQLASPDYRIEIAAIAAQE